MAVLQRHRNRLLIAVATVVGILVVFGLTIFAGRAYVAHRVPGWIAQLKDGDPSVRRDAARWLNDLAPPTPDVLAAFQVALRDDNAGVRQQAAHGLGKFGHAAREAIPLLLNALNDEDDSVRFHAARSLEAVGHDSTR
jgi:HEAT repeat protein